jgi:hypothetical protein
MSRQLPDDRAEGRDDRPAAGRYTSFLVRCWHVGGDERRIEIEQIQTGGRMRVRTLPAALAWIDGCCREVFGDGATALAASDRAGGGERPAGEGGREGLPEP